MMPPTPLAEFCCCRFKQTLDLLETTSLSCFICREENAHDVKAHPTVGTRPFFPFPPPGFSCDERCSRELISLRHKTLLPYPPSRTIRRKSAENASLGSVRFASGGRALSGGTRCCGGGGHALGLWCAFTYTTQGRRRNEVIIIAPCPEEAIHKWKAYTHST